MIRCSTSRLYSVTFHYNERLRIQTQFGTQTYSIDVHRFIVFSYVDVLGAMLFVPWFAKVQSRLCEWTAVLSSSFGQQKNKQEKHNKKSHFAIFYIFFLRIQISWYLFVLMFCILRSLTVPVPFFANRHSCRRNNYAW